MQMVFAAMLIDALHAALEDREEAFDGVGVDVAANVFVLGMRDEFMRGEILAGATIDTALVGHERAFLGDVGADDRHDIAHAGGIDMEGAGTATALDQRNDRVLVRTATRHRGALHATDIRLIHFHGVAAAAHRSKLARGHSEANAMAQEPSGLVGAFEYAVHLVSADTLLRGAHKVDGL